MESMSELATNRKSSIETLDEAIAQYIALWCRKPHLIIMTDKFYKALKNEIVSKYELDTALTSLKYNSVDILRTHDEISTQFTLLAY